MDQREHFGSGDDDEEHSEDHGNEGEEEYEQEDPDEVIARDYDGDRSAYLRDHPFAFGGMDGDVGELLARLDPSILARVPQELLSGLAPEALASLLDRGERRMPGEGGSGGSRASSDQPPSGPPPPPDTDFEGNPSAVLAAISHPQTDPDMLVMALMHLSTMIWTNQGIQASRYVSHICKCFVRKDMPAFIQETCLQVLVNFLEVEDIGQGSCAGRIAQEPSVLFTIRSMLEELPCTRDSRDVLENMLKIIWVVVRRDRRSVQQALPAGVLFSALKRLKDIIHKNSINEVLSTCAVLLGESSGGTDVETCNQVPVLCELLERSESETVSLSLACASAIVNKLSSSQSSRGAVLKHFIGTSAYAPTASIAIPPSPSFFLAEALLKLLHQKKRILNDPQAQLDMSGRRASAPVAGMTIRSFALNLIKKLFSLEQLSAEHLMRPQLIAAIMESLTIPADCDSVAELCTTLLNYSFGTCQFRSSRLLSSEYSHLSPIDRVVCCINDNNEALLRSALAECDASVPSTYVDPSSGLSLLALAARKASPHCIRLLVEHGSPVQNSVLGAAPALHVALWACRGDNVKELLARGADPSAVDATGVSAIELARNHAILSPQFLSLLESPSLCVATASQPRYLCVSDPQKRQRLRRTRSLEASVNGESNILGVLHSPLPWTFIRIEGNWGKLSPHEYQRARESTNSSPSSSSSSEAFVEHNPESEGWCVLSHEGEEYFVSCESPDIRPVPATCPILDPRLFDSFLPLVREMLSSLVHVALEPSQSLSVQNSVARIVGSVIRECPPPIIKFLFNLNPRLNETLTDTYTVLKSPTKLPAKSKEGGAATAREGGRASAVPKVASIESEPSETAILFARFACGLLQSTPLLSLNSGESSASILSSVASVLAAPCPCVIPLLRDMKFGPILASLLCCGVPSLQKEAKEFEKKFKAVLALGPSEVQRELSGLVIAMSTHTTTTELVGDLKQLRDLINAGKLSWFDISYKVEGSKSLLSTLCAYLLDFHQDDSKHHEAQLFQSAFIEVFCEYTDGLRGSSPEIGDKRKAVLDVALESAVSASEGLKAIQLLLKLLRDLFGTGLESLTTDIPRLASQSFQNRRGLRSLRDALELKLERDISGRTMFSEGRGRVLSADLGCSTALLEQWIRDEMCIEWFIKPFNELHYINVIGAHPVELPALADSHLGIVNWIGTNAGSALQFRNPSAVGLVLANSSCGSRLSFGNIWHYLCKNIEKCPSTTDAPQSWVSFDLAVHVRPTAYSLRSFGDDFLQSWQLQGSMDGKSWQLLHDALSLNPFSSASKVRVRFTLPESVSRQTYKIFRIVQTGPNGANRHNLSFCDFELFGSIVNRDVVSPLSTFAGELRTAKQNAAASVGDLHIGTRVVRAVDWCWGSQDSNGPGTVVEPHSRLSRIRSLESGTVVRGWVTIRWDNGSVGIYRAGLRGCFDIIPVVPGHELSASPMCPVVLSGASEFQGLASSLVEGESAPDPDSTTISQRPRLLLKGMRVIRGPDWKWNDQDQNGPGTVTQGSGESSSEDWVRVKWDHGSQNGYRWGAENCYDLLVIDPDHAVVKEQRSAFSASSPLPAASPSSPSSRPVSSSSSASHDGVTCDCCHQSPIKGVRYKCAVRPDFDLCHTCYSSGREAEKSDSQFFPYYAIAAPGALAVLQNVTGARLPSSVTSDGFIISHFLYSRANDKGSSSARVSFSSSAFPPAFDSQSLDRAIAWQEERRSSILSVPGPDISAPLKLTPELPWCNVSLIPRKRCQPSRSGACNAGDRVRLWLSMEDSKKGARLEIQPHQTVMQAASQLLFESNWKSSSSRPKLVLHYGSCQSDTTVAVPSALKWSLQNLNVVSPVLVFHAIQQSMPRDWLSERGLEASPIQLACSLNHEKMRELYAEAMLYYDADPEAPFDEAPHKRSTLEGLSLKSDCVLALKLMKAIWNLGVTYGLPEDIHEHLVSDRLCMKVSSILQEQLVFVGGTVPIWCSVIVTFFPLIINPALRSKLFCSVGLGTTQSIERLQQLPPEQRFDQEIDKLKTDTAEVGRSNVLAWARSVASAHGNRQTGLQFTFADEIGHGKGPTSEFFTLIADAFLDASLGMWIFSGELKLDASPATKHVVPGEEGVFPQPFCAHMQGFDAVLQNFTLLGVMIGKALSFGQMLPLPMSLPFTKAICGLPLDFTDLSKAAGKENFKTFKHFCNMIIRHRCLSGEEADEYRAHCEAYLESLCVGFEKTVLHVVDAKWVRSDVELIEGGSSIPLTFDRLQQYIDAIQNFYLGDGIALQVEAVRAGIASVFPPHALSILGPHGLLQALGSLKVRVHDSFSSAAGCIVLHPQQIDPWSEEELLACLIPSNGHSRESPAFLHLVHVLARFSEFERRQFLQFVTAVPSLPPGGLKSLSPPIGVKLHEGNEENLPTASTCQVNASPRAALLPAWQRRVTVEQHYLKLPAYGSVEKTRSKLLKAIDESSQFSFS